MQDFQDYTQTDRLSSKLLRIYTTYRVILALLLAGVFFSGFASEILGSRYSQLFAVVSLSYILLALATVAIGHFSGYRSSAASLFFILITDIVVLTLLMHASGSLSSGLGFLMLVTVAAGSIFFTGQLGILVAAVASICIVVESIVSSYFLLSRTNTVFPSGLLGILLFITALIFQYLNRAMRSAQEVADKEAEQSAHLQQLNEMIVQRMLTGIVVADAHDRIELINRSAVKLLGGHMPGIPLSPGQSLRVVPGLYQQMKRWREHPWLRTPPFLPKNGATEVQANFTTLHQGSQRRTLIYLDDLRAMAQHAQQLKLSSLGRLTGSIAHEIRNPLGAISHASQLLGELRAEDGDIALLTNIIEKHTRRVNQIVENVLQLSRQKAPATQKFSLNIWLTRFLVDYQDGCGRDCMLETNLQSPGGQVSFDPSHLQQVLTNLLDNAIRYSFQSTGEYWAEIRVFFDPEQENPLLEVIDRGPGVPAEGREKLFEPFYTTSGEGSGLGLYIARQLCEINYSSINYRAPDDGLPGAFRIRFAHPDKLLPSKEYEPA